jgi:hypothetical protein
VIGVCVCVWQKQTGAESRLKLEEGGLGRFEDDAASNYRGLIECFLLLFTLDPFGLTFGLISRYHAQLRNDRSQ